MVATMSTTAKRGSSKGCSSEPNATPPVDVPSGQQLLRTMNHRDRMKLTQGKLIAVVDSEGTKLMDFPLALFNVASINKELVVDDKITIPANLDIEQAKRFLFLMMKVASAPAISSLGATENTYIDLHFHSAAEYLGMSSFTQKIFDLYFKRVNQQVPVVANIEAIGAVRTPPGDKIFKQMAYIIGIKYFENEILNRPAFEAYLLTNPRLRAAVEDTAARKEVAAKRQLQHEMSTKAFLERERKRELKVRLAEERVQQANGAQVQKKVDRANVEERTQREIAVRKSMLEKKRTGQKLSFEETRAHEKVFGKAVAN
jgi:hypothetical protein